MSERGERACASLAGAVSTMVDKRSTVSPATVAGALEYAPATVAGSFGKATAEIAAEAGMSQSTW